jgi:hydrophobe/amphiphile efflux-1 (HAE1) family protein
MDVRRISEWSIHHPVPVIVLFLLLTIAGLWSFFNLGIDESPNIDVPVVVVTVVQPGAAPSELETQITRKIEDAVAGIGNIKHINSSVNEGASATSIEFELGTNIDRAVNDVRNEVSKVRMQLPQGIEEPVISRVDFVGGPFVTFTVESSSRSLEDLSWVVDNDIARALLSVKGVGQVQRSGGIDREVRINLDPARLESLGITADQVSQQVKAMNIDLPGGRGELGPSEQTIRTLGSARTVDQLRAQHIMLPNGKWARLDTLGEVLDGYADRRQLSLLNGKQVVTFSVVRSFGSNMVDVQRSVEQKLAQLEKTLPHDIKITRIRTEAKFVERSYEACMEHLILGAILAVIVIWFFLKDWRAALISAVAMPLSLIPTFAVMKVMGFTLNNMSLLGLSLVIGVLVDDAIVEVENIIRHMAMGKKPFQASLEAADEIGLAVVATTTTIVVVFIPVAFMGGIPGQFLRQFGWTVAVAVLFSLLVARMLTPLMAAHWLRSGHEETGMSARAMSIYDLMLAWALKKRALTVAIAVAFFVISILMFRSMPTSVIGNVDRGETLLQVELPPGSSLPQSEAVTQRLTRILLARPEVNQVFASIGSATSGRGRNQGSAGEVHKSNLYILLEPRDQRKLSQQEFERDVRPQLLVVPGARLSFNRLMGISGKLKIVLTANDEQDLRHTAEALETQMRGIRGVSDIVSSLSLQRPELLVKPDFDRAAEQGVSVTSIARTALIATIGDIDANLAKFNLSDRQINIRVELDPHYRNDLQVLSNLRVVGKGGRLVPLNAVAQTSFGSGPSQINRLDRARQVTIEASLDPGFTLGEALTAVHNLPAYKMKPPTVLDTPQGDVEIQKDIFNGFGQALSSAVMLIYAVLVLLFNGFLHPFAIMMSLPLALGGALMALIMGHQSLGFYALIGIVMLMGLVTKNAILLVEYCLMAMHAGVDRHTAIVQSGEARMRPILMTTVAMIAGMLPIALGWGAGSEARQPMAICVIGGLITSTLLTLIVVPVVFTYVDDLGRWFGRTILRLPQKEEPSGPHPSAKVEH